MRRTVLFVAVLLLCSCRGERVPTWLSSVVMDAPPTPAVTVDVLCDSSGGSSGCSEASLPTVLTSIASTLGPGSVVRLQGMADHVADDRQLATYTITAPRRHRDHACGVGNEYSRRWRMHHAAYKRFMQPRRNQAHLIVTLSDDSTTITERLAAEESASARA